MKTKLLSLVHGGYSSHTVRVLEISKALRETGEYEIIFSGEGEQMSALVQPAGFEWIETPCYEKRKILDVIENRLVPKIYDDKDAERFYEIESDLLKKQKPDIILRDHFREMAGIAAKKLGIYDIFVQMASCCPYYHFDFRPKHFPKIMHLLIPEPLRGRISPILEFPFRRMLHGPIRRQVKKQGVQLNRKVPEGYEADLVLFPDEPSLFPFKNLRRNYKYIGAILPVNEPCPQWTNSFRIDPRKKILVTMGSTGEQEKPEFFREIFKDNKFAVAVYTAKSMSFDDFYGANRFDVNKILPFCDLFITHGGIGSTYTGLKNGIPMIVLPNHFEQQINGRQLEKIGAGISFYPFDITPEIVRESLENILREPKYKKNAEIFCRGMIKNPLELAVNYIGEGFERFREKSS